MKKIIILRGIPASGKSSYAKNLIKENPGMYKRINRDDLRHMLDGYLMSNSNEKFIKKTRDYLITQALHAGKHVIVDDTNISETNLVRITQLAEEYKKETGQQIRIETKVFDIELDEAIKRDQARANSVGVEVIKRMYRQFYGKNKNEEGRFPTYRKQDETLPKAIICDLDGTLALMHDRNPFDAAKCEQDLPNQPVVNLVKQYKKLGYKLLLLSGRDGQFQTETENWLNANEISYDALWMRQTKDSRKDNVIKMELFETHIENKFFIEFVLDDRNQVVDLWRKELHLPCLQVYYGDF